jgi:hypothetical protein
MERGILINGRCPPRFFKIRKLWMRFLRIAEWLRSYLRGGMKTHFEEEERYRTCGMHLSEKR